VLVAGVAAAAGARAATVPIAVDPTVGDPDTVFHVEIPAAFKIKESRDRYWFIVHGPGGKRCESMVTDRVGITPPRKARRVFVDLPGVRVITRQEIDPGPWCSGTFNGHVEFRDWRPHTRRYVIRRIGDFSWQVEPAQSSSRPSAE
jgi:hypothetical protein